jgi:23S rRNA pseudouridine2457 synthase
MILAFHKPYGVLSQFTHNGSPNRTLAEFHFPKNVYPLGRLDADSEGLLLLSDEKNLNQKLLLPENEHRRRYWAQVERVPTKSDMIKLEQGVFIQGYKTKPCRAKILDPQPNPSERIPPIRARENIPTTWIELELTEGKNRQARRMTAAIGFPTLRLIRVQIGQFQLGGLPPGKWRALSEMERNQIFL